MEYVVIVFRSRSSTVGVASTLNRFGIYNEIISTPKEAHVGCGLSLKIKLSDFDKVKNWLKNTLDFKNASYFKVKEVAGKRQIKSI